MKIIFSDHENQHLHATPARVGVTSGPPDGSRLMMAFPQVECETLTNP
jgi:hypothetical protein